MGISIRITGSVSPAVEVVRWNGAIVPIVQGMYTIRAPLQGASTLIHLDLRGSNNALLERRLLQVQRTESQKG